MTKDEFLSNLKNKELFIRLLGETLKEIGCNVMY